MTEPARSPIGLREVLLVALAAALVVLGLQVLSTYVPAVGDALDSGPLLIVGLVVLTAFVLYRALRPRG